MKRPFRDHHTLAIFDAYEMQRGPLDLFLRNYFRANKAIGAKDRKAISETIYGIMRWQGLIDYLCDKPLTWEKRLSQFTQFFPERYVSDSTIPLHIRMSFPKTYFQYLSEQLGEDKAIEFCLSSNDPAPTTVRVNISLISRPSLLEQWTSSYDVSACAHSAHGITFHKKINFFGLDEFKKGWFEVQDEASQLIAELVTAGPGDQVLDFCAGSGGKSLAIAPKLQGKGQLYLHDIRKSALQEAKKRLYRAHIQNAQILYSDALHKAALLHSMDWVLVDAPCSGSGTLRRNPDMKWKFEETALNRLIEEQRMIFSEAIPFLKKGGRIVYATCSVLPIENECQAAYFEKTHGLRRINAFSSFPKKSEMDGFFGIVFVRE